MAQALARLSLAALLFLSFAHAAPAKNFRQSAIGKFDFYVLALSWSPSFCTVATERGEHTPQCGVHLYSFIVHGLWPASKEHLSELCQVPAPRVDRAIVNSILDLMPATKLILHEWRHHGTCSGLSPRTYFRTTRKARAMIRLPPVFTAPEASFSVTPTQVEQAFIDSNTNLGRRNVAVRCDDGRLTEVYICLSRDLQFYACPDVLRHSCQSEHMTVPPLRWNAQPSGL